MYIIPEFNNQHQNPQNLKIETYNGRIKTLKDALLVLEGTRLGYLPKIKRRLNGLEREFIKPNTIFAWNETECGMKRWTDGKNWSASKVTGPFLTYKELDAGKVSVKKDGLIKQSFSLTTKQGQKLHLISYYKDSESAESPTAYPSKDPMLKDLKPNANIYQEYLLYYDQYLNYDTQDQSVMVYPPFSSSMIPQMPQVSQMPQMPQIQMSQMQQMPQMAQISHMPQMAQMAQMSPVHQVHMAQNPQHLSHIPQVSTLQQPYPSMTPDSIPTQPYMSHSAPSSASVPMNKMSVPQVMISPQTGTQDPPQISPQLSEASNASLQTPIQQSGSQTSSQTDSAHSPSLHPLQYTNVTTTGSGRISGPVSGSSSSSNQPLGSTPPYPVYGTGYYQYPVSYYYPNQMDVPLSRPSNMDRPIDRLESYPRDARTNSIHTTSSNVPAERFTQNSNNSSSSISTSPTNTRDDDSQTLKMLDKGFSNK